MKSLNLTNSTLNLPITAGILLSTLVASLAVWLELSPHAPEIPVNDQWIFLDPVLHEKSLWDQFNQQVIMPRQGLGNFLYTWPILTAGWSGQWQLAWMIAIYAIASWIALAWKAKVSTLNFFDVLLPFVFIKPTMQDTLVYTPNPAYSAIPLVLLFSLLYLLETRITDRLKMPLVAALTWVATCTHFGFFTPFALIGWAILDRRSSFVQKAQFVSIAILAILAFFLQPGDFSSDSGCMSLGFINFPAYFSFAGIMITRGIGLPTPPESPWIALSIFCVIATMAVISWRKRADIRTNHNLISGACALLAFSCGFAIFAAVGRSCSGPAPALASRYVGMMIPVVFLLWTIFNGSKKNWLDCSYGPDSCWILSNTAGQTTHGLGDSTTPQFCSMLETRNSPF